MQSEGFYVNENPLTLAGIEPATFRFVAQYFNLCATLYIFQRMGIILIFPFVTNFLKYLPTTRTLKRKATLELSLFSFSFLNVDPAQGIQNIIEFSPQNYQ